RSTSRLSAKSIFSFQPSPWDHWTCRPPKSSRSTYPESLLPAINYALWHHPNCVPRGTCSQAHIFLLSIGKHTGHLQCIVPKYGLRPVAFPVRCPTHADPNTPLQNPFPVPEIPATRQTHVRKPPWARHGW